MNGIQVQAVGGYVVVTLHPDDAHSLGFSMGDDERPFGDARDSALGSALVHAANHADYHVPAHFAPREGNAPPGSDMNSVSDARWPIGTGPRIVVTPSGSTRVYSHEGDPHSDWHKYHPPTELIP